MSTASLGQLTLDLVANTAGFERGMNQAERALKSATKEANFQAQALDKLIGQIDPTVAAYSRLDRMEQQLEAHRKAGRLPTDDYEVYRKKLEETRNSLAATDKAIGANTRGFNQQGISAKAMAANLRNVPAQFTDIAVSLQSGQAPLTVFLQQGGQLKDMFGGIGPAAKALGGYVLGLINPFTIAAGAAAVLALAYKQGSDETTAFSSALATSGNTAGTTTAQLSDLAQQISLTGGTVGKASGVLAQLAASTLIPKEAFEGIAVAAIAFEKATGQAAEETVKNFEKIAKDPAAEILKLNETMNFLTATTYEHIKALQEQGNVQEAAAVANTAYEEALGRTATAVQKNLGTLETGWNAVKSAAKAAWDAALNIGREDTLDQQIKKLDDQLNAIANARANNNTRGNGVAPADDFREQALEADKTQKLILKNEQDRRAASKGFQQEQQATALRDQVELDKLRRETESNADKRARELGQYRELVERRVTAASASGDKSLLISAERQAKDIAAINEKYKDPAVKKTPAVREDAGQKMLDTLRQQNAALQLQSDSVDEQTGKYKTLGAQAQELAKFQQQIADIKSKDIQTADQKSLLANEALITAQLKRNVALEQEVAARKTSYEEAQKLQAFQDTQDSKLSSAQDVLNSQLTGLGQGNKTRDRLKEDISIRKEYQSELSRLEAQHNKGQISDDLFAQESTKLQESLAARVVMQQDYYNQVDEAQGSFFLGASEAWANYADTAQNYSQQAADFVSGALDGLTSSTATFLDSIIRGTSSVGDAFAQLGLSMLNSIVGALEKMAAQWIVYQAVQLLTGKAAQAGAAGILIANAQATAFQASLAAFASTAAIPIVGPFLAPGAAAAAASFAAPLVAGVATSALAGMAHDGIDSVPQTGTWLLQKGERVTTAQTSAKLDKTLNDIKSPTGTGSTTVNLIEDASRAGQSQERTGDQGEKMIDVFVADLLGDGRSADAMSRKFGLQTAGR
jgi:lambda family phage tail tape measure protein